MFRVARMVVSLMLLLAIGLIAACSDATGPTSDSAGTTPFDAQAAVLLNPRLAYCTPQPTATASALIGPAGGSIKAGKHKLTFPQGALSRTTLITMVAPRDTVNQVVFGPEGLTFPLGKHPALEMSYKNCRIPLIAVKRVVYTNDNLQVEERLLTVDNLLTGEVAARLKHFSRYSIAY